MQSETFLQLIVGPYLPQKCVPVLLCTKFRQHLPFYNGTMRFTRAASVLLSAARAQHANGVKLQYMHPIASL